MADLEFEDIQAALSIREQLTDKTIARRTFLKAAAAGIGITAMPSWLVEKAAWAANPIGPNDGVLVLIQMGGGNDGLNTVVPTDNGTYYQKRPTINIGQSTALPIAPGVGLHPALTGIKSRFDQGKVAIVEGVGVTHSNLSHFSSVATWQEAWAPGGARSGWVGRYLDALGTDPLYGVTVSTSVPLHMQGVRNAATALPNRDDGTLTAPLSDDVSGRLANGIRAMGVGSTGYGELADMLAAANRNAVDIGTTVGPHYNPALPEHYFLSQMTLAARLINANLGIRVFAVSLGSFDTHDNQVADHDEKLSDLNAGIEAFFSTLSNQFGGRVAVATFSEFGRRVQENGTGTDHGTAAPLFIIGDGVKGGFYGERPSLTDLDWDGNLKPKLQFYSVYATLLDSWLNADSRALLGANVENLGFFESAPSGTPINPPPPVDPPPVSPPPVAPPTLTPIVRPVTQPQSYRLITARGVVSSFGGASSLGNANKPRITTVASTPSQKGYWAATATGAIAAFGDAVNHGSMAGKALNSPVISMASTPTGKGYWLLGGDGGIFTFGDATFYGSTGNMRLNQPVVAMCAAPVANGGYWFVASDGGVFCFGSGANFFGSTGNMRLNKPVVGMAATPTGKGYWLVASDGGIFTFGDATFYGSTGDIRLNAPIVSMAATPTGKGYRLAAADGGVFCFGDATYSGNASSAGDQVVCITT